MAGVWGQGTGTGPGNFALGKSPKEIESHQNPKIELIELENQIP